MGGLGENASVGIRRPGAVEGVDEVVGSYPDYDTPYPWSDIYTITSSDYGKFFSDDPEFCLLHDTENNQIIIKKIVQCSVENKDYPAMFLYNGTAIQAPSEANFTTDSKGEMSFSWYKDSVSAENRLEGAPVYAGNYILRVDVAAYENMSAGYTEVSVYIEKAPAAPNAPDGSREVEFEITRVSETELPKGWIWLDSDADKTLEVNKAVTATAVYNGTDKGNYETESVEILITRKPCTHTGGTELKNVRKATYTSTGYTGDTYCKTCGERIRTGKSIAMLSYTAVDIAANSNTLNVNAKLGWSGAKVKITWSSVSDAEGYDVYAAKCGKDLKLVKTVKKGTTQALLTKAGGAKVKTSSGYKVRVRAYRIINGKKKYIANSLVLHTMGKSNKKNTNATKVKASRSAYALTKGKTAAISVKVTKQNRKKSLPGTAHAPRLRYWSTNTKVATVGSAGKIRAVGKGSCYVYVAAQNGVKTRVKVTVK